MKTDDYNIKDYLTIRKIQDIMGTPLADTCKEVPFVGEKLLDYAMLPVELLQEFIDKAKQLDEMLISNTNTGQK